MEELHQQKVKHVIKSAEGSAGLVHKNTKPTAWRGGTQILKREEEDARLLDRCEAMWKEWAKHRQCEESVQTLEDKPWENEELKKLEEALPRLKERWRKSVKIVQGENRNWMRWFPPNNPFGFCKRNKRRNRGVLGESGAEWESGRSKLAPRCS